MKLKVHIMPIWISDFALLIPFIVALLSLIGGPMLLPVWVILMLMLEIYVVYGSCDFYKKIIHLQKQSFLNGFKLWDWETHYAFLRLGSYIGHGLCYEASAALMLALKDHFKVRYVYGKTCGEQGVRHCWVEAKAYGIWWALDSTWSIPTCFPAPTLVYRIITMTRVVRIVSEDDFFSHEIAAKMAEMVKNPRSSYIFHDLACFRQAYWRNDAEDCDEMVIENHEWWELFCEKKSGWNLLLIDVFNSNGRPVTPRIIREFLTHENRLDPKRRSFRKALAIEKMVKRCRNEAAALHEKTGSPIEIEFTTKSTYKLTELAP